MEDVIQINDQFYIHAASPRVDEHALVLKHGDTFALFDHVGDIEPVGLGEEGVYHEGTRYLSRFKLLVNHTRPLLLSSTVRQDNLLLTVDLTNPDISSGQEVVLPRDTVHVCRSAFLLNGVCYTRMRVRNYALHPVDIALTLFFDADFVDIFEVRGTKRRRRGHYLPLQCGSDWVEMSYCGLDGVTRRTRITFSPQPRQVEDNQALFEETLGPQGEMTFDVNVCCDCHPKRHHADFEACFAGLNEKRRENRLLEAHVHTSNELFNDWLNRSAADLHMMVTETDVGPYPYAGVPWYSTVFGRDGIITALEYLWINPNLARGVLAYLALTQATTVNNEQDAEPGKVLHETRKGEMAALGEIPFGRYYGTVDATPLFIVLAEAYYRRTGDVAFLESLWPNIDLALKWIEKYGDIDSDGLFEYVRHAEHGLVTQGWKDSYDSVFHDDGRLAEPPVALCEVQGYIFAAWRAAARLADLLGKSDQAQELRRLAQQLQKRFDEAFWCEDLSTYALALDAQKRPCRVRASNAGHCLMSGIASRKRARQVARTLLAEHSFSGWGIRTVSKGESRYNPMAYHNGSVWPHDNALIARGFARYGLQRSVRKVLTGLFAASLFFDLRRMPELFCGFTRRSGEGPTLYPIACAPQAWAAGTVFSLLQSCLGMTIDAPRRRICLDRPMLPKWLQHVWIRRLQVGDASVDLRLTHQPHDVAIRIRRRVGNVEIVAVK